MKKPLLALFTIFLLALPAFAFGQFTGPEQAALATLTTAKETLVKCDATLAADGGDEATAAQSEAYSEYNSALDAARKLRDEGSEGRGGEFGIALHKVSADPTDATATALVEEIAQLVTDAKDWLIVEGPGLALNAVFFLLILFAFKVLASIGSKITNKALSGSSLNVSDLLRDVATGLVSKIIFFIGVLIALDVIGVNTAPLLAGIGVLGFVVGFALQDTLSNFASGVMILLYRPYDLGDVITAAGETGSVKEMSLVSTTLGTPDNQKLIIPNSAIWGGTIRNVTAKATRRVDMVVGVSYSDDLDRAQELLTEIVSSHELVLSDPAPVVMVNNLGDSAVEFVVRPWSKTSDYWAVYWDLTKTIKQRLDKEGISFPFPQSDVHIVEMPSEK